ncbi:energy-coupling factor transporter ATPase [Halanaerobium salsuginis]|jgi:energy-coupling factor transport system ATP-binding protein|uniref:Energy-coupling factor transport system ATP-binding protein n=1 Tax=Halanaerobium salsuginis TaxID=29563 RepID=A0A1I4LI99_9FIRM|nr:energy-coupling factor transporter ATPase [Halanaerobium salsuginis]SFL90735.1 energy-coupling factor transport system ATP-binding protein [Halanaerobium salsuginis]
MSLIEIEEVAYLYENDDSERPALQNINLQIEAGDFAVIIGSNGSGKSTLAKLLNVLLMPSSGKLTVAGLDSTIKENTWSIRQKVGMVFQNPDNQLVASIVEDDVAFGPENLGIPGAEIRERIDKALTMVGMSGFQKFAPHKLSGGQKQRIAIAGVIAMEPDCIVLDEPTAMLDPQGRKEVMETIEYLNKEKGITIVHITHFMEEAVNADQVIVMNQGKILRQGSPRDIFRHVEELKKINLDIPVVVEVAEYLRQEKVAVPDVLTVDELVKSIC